MIFEINIYVMKNLKYIKLFEAFTGDEVKDFLDFYHEIGVMQRASSGDNKGYSEMFVKHMNDFFKSYLMVIFIGEFVKLRKSDKLNNWLNVNKTKSLYDLEEIIDNISITDDSININGTEIKIIDDILRKRNAAEQILQSKEWLNLIELVSNNHDDIESIFNTIINTKTDRSVNAQREQGIDLLITNFVNYVKKIIRLVDEDTGSIKTKEFIINAAKKLRHSVNYWKTHGSNKDYTPI